jgi:hypothetical protein
MTWVGYRESNLEARGYVRESKESSAQELEAHESRCTRLGDQHEMIDELAFHAAGFPNMPPEDPPD